VRPHDFVGKIEKKQLEDQWEICHLYQVFTFKKMGEKGRRIEGTQGRCGRDMEERFKFIDTNKQS